MYLIPNKIKKETLFLNFVSGKDLMQLGVALSGLYMIHSLVNGLIRIAYLIILFIIGFVLCISTEFNYERKLYHTLVYKIINMKGFDITYENKCNFSKIEGIKGYYNDRKYQKQLKKRGLSKSEERLY